MIRKETKWFAFGWVAGWFVIWIIFITMGG